MIVQVSKTRAAGPAGLYDPSMMTGFARKETGSSKMDALSWICAMIRVPKERLITQRLRGCFWKCKGYKMSAREAERGSRGVVQTQYRIHVIGEEKSSSGIIIAGWWRRFPPIAERRRANIDIETEREGNGWNWSVGERYRRSGSPEKGTSLSGL